MPFLIEQLDNESLDPILHALRSPKQLVLHRCINESNRTLYVPFTGKYPCGNPHILVHVHKGIFACGMDFYLRTGKIHVPSPYILRDVVRSHPSFTDHERHACVQRTWKTEKKSH